MRLAAPLALAVVLLAPAGVARAADGDLPSGLTAGLVELREAVSRAEAADAAYEEAADRLRRQQERVAEVTRELADTRGELAAARDLAGRLARQQYRHGGLALPTTLRVLLGEDPGEAAGAERVARRAATAQAATVRRLDEGEGRDARVARQERAELDERQAHAAELRRDRDAARQRLTEAVTRLAALAPDTPGGAPGADGVPRESQREAAAPRSSARRRGVSR